MPFDARIPLRDVVRLPRLLTALALLVLVLGALAATAVDLPASAAASGGQATDRQATSASEAATAAVPAAHLPASARVSVPGDVRADEAVGTIPAASDAAVPAGRGQRPAPGRAPPLA